MSSQWTFVVRAPRGEAVLLKHLVPHLRRWKGIKQIGDTQRQWELDGGEINLEGRGDRCSALLCTYSTQQSDEGAQRILKFAEWASSELGWQLIEPDDWP